MAALQQFVFGVHFFDLTNRIRSYHVFEYDQIARHGDGKIWFGGNNQSEYLQLRSPAQLALGPVYNDFT